MRRQVDMGAHRLFSWSANGPHYIPGLASPRCKVTALKTAYVVSGPRVIRILPERTNSTRPNGRSSAMKLSQLLAAAGHPQDERAGATVDHFGLVVLGNLQDFSSLSHLRLQLISAISVSTTDWPVWSIACTTSTSLATCRIICSRVSAAPRQVMVMREKPASVGSGTDHQALDVVAPAGEHQGHPH